jgi:uncharacterized protein YndB with AHSA1/START domain
MQSQTNSSIRISRSFSASPQEVWQAWTDPRLVKSWFGSDPNGKVLDASLDVRPGGTFEVTFRNSDDTQFTCAGTYKEIKKYQRLVFTWTWKDRPEVQESVTLVFQARQTGTLMIFRHANIDAGTTHDYETGWRSTFDKLERTLKAGSQSSG